MCVCGGGGGGGGVGGRGTWCQMHYVDQCGGRYARRIVPSLNSPQTILIGESNTIKFPAVISK